MRLSITRVSEQASCIDSHREAVGINSAREENDGFNLTTDTQNRTKEIIPEVFLLNEFS